MKRLLLTTALVMAVGVAVGGVYLDTSTVKQQARQLQVRQFTLQDIDRAVYGPDGLTNPQLKVASFDERFGTWPSADPHGNIVTADRPLRLEPKEYSAQASSPLPADCPQPNAADDTAFCQ